MKIYEEYYFKKICTTGNSVDNDVLRSCEKRDATNKQSCENKKRGSADSKCAECSCRSDAPDTTKSPTAEKMHGFDSEWILLLLLLYSMANGPHPHHSISSAKNENSKEKDACANNKSTPKDGNPGEWAHNSNT